MWFDQRKVNLKSWKQSNLCKVIPLLTTSTFVVEVNYQHHAIYLCFRATPRFKRPQTSLADKCPLISSGDQPQKAKVDLILVSTLYCVPPTYFSHHHMNLSFFLWNFSENISMFFASKCTSYMEFQYFSHVLTKNNWPPKATKTFYSNTLYWHQISSKIHTGWFNSCKICTAPLPCEITES